MRYSPGPETGLTAQVTTAPAPGRIPDQPCVDCLDDSLVAEHSRPAVLRRVAFWPLASVFTATMLGTTLPLSASAAVLAFSILLTILCVFSLASIRKTV